MDKVERSEEIIRRLFDPKNKRTDKYVDRDIKLKYVEHLLEARWGDICGEMLAKHCCLHRVEKDTVVVRTESSSWAHHLLMVKNLFLQKINMALLGYKIIKDLKFYSGGMLKRQSARQQETVFAAKEQEYTKCPRCGARMLAGKNLCSVCQREEKEALRGKITELLRIEPWLDYESCVKYYPCDRILFNAAKDALQGAYFEKVRLGQAAGTDCMLAVMFLTGKKPEEINEKIYANTLEFLRRNSSVSAFRVGLHGKKQ